jgi:NAD(P)-dependent dehydrogenase (short-subunit alcohol dehydrogenase family)
MGTSRVWLITGASSGLGRALAEVALERGDRVVAGARHPGAVADLEDRYGGRAIAARLDVTDPSQVREGVAAGLRAFDRLDVVVNNAGFGLFGALEELSDEDLRREFETNVFGALHVTRAALPELRRRRSGHIIQISSLEGIAPARSTPIARQAAETLPSSSASVNGRRRNSTSTSSSLTGSSSCVWRPRD